MLDAYHGPECTSEYMYSNVVKKTCHVESSFCIKLDYKYQWIHLKWRLGANTFLDFAFFYSVLCFFFLYIFYIYTLSVNISSVLRRISICRIDSCEANFCERIFSHEKLNLISAKQKVRAFIFFNNTDNIVEKKWLQIIYQKF